MHRIPFKKGDLAAGLNYLFDSDAAHYGQDIGVDYYSKYARPIITHPFGCSLPDAKDDFTCRHNMKMFMTAGTNISVDATIAHIRWALGSARHVIKKLRIFNLQCDAKQLAHHRCFFEIWTPVGVFFCGECNDFSGAGRYGSERMREIFNIVSLCQGVEVEEFVIPYEEGLQFTGPVVDLVA